MTHLRRGPRVLPPAAVEVVQWLPRPLFIPPGSTAFFIGALPNTQLDISAVMEHPTRLPQALEGV